MTPQARRHLMRERPRNASRRLRHLFLAAVAATSLAACSFGQQDPDRAALDVRGSAPVTPVAPGQAAAGGVLRYDGYEAAVALDGDTVTNVAERVGLSGSELGAYNGLQPDTVLRAGDELVLPPRTGGYGGRPVAQAGAVVPQTPGSDPASAAPADPFAPGGVAVADAGTVTPGTVNSGAGTAGPGGEIVSAPLGPAIGAGVAGAETTGSPSARSGWSAASIEQALDQPAAPAADAPSDTASGGLASAAEAAAGIEPTGSELPRSRPANTEVASTAAVGTTANEDVASVGSGSSISPPPSANAPLPEDPLRPTPPSSPELGQLQSATPEVAPPSADARTTERAAEEADRAAAQELARLDTGNAGGTASDLGIAFRRPVEGAIVVPYNISNSGTRNEGVDFGAPAGTPVVAAAAGEVALVSQSLGGLGTIVLVRHNNDVLTVYGRVDDVGVAKGTRVGAGEQIGVVARGDGSAPPKMHFEIRRGADSVNPELYIGG